MNWIAKIAIGCVIALPIPTWALTGLGHNTSSATDGGLHLTLPRSEDGQSDKLGLKRPGAEDKRGSYSQSTEPDKRAIDKRAVDRRLQDRRTANDEDGFITFGKKSRHSGGRM